MTLSGFEPTIKGFAVQCTTAAPQSLLDKIIENDFLVDFGKEYKNLVSLHTFLIQYFIYQWLDKASICSKVNQ